MPSIKYTGPEPIEWGGVSFEPGKVVTDAPEWLIRKANSNPSFELEGVKAPSARKPNPLITEDLPPDDGGPGDETVGDLTVSWRGPRAKWAILKDGSPLQTGFLTREDAEARARELSGQA